MPSSDLVIRADHVVTCDDAMTVIENGAVAVRNDRIVAVGPAAAVSLDGAELVEAAGRILMPGLINMHCHAGDSLFRGLVENLPLEPWLQTVWRAERAILDPATCRLGAELGLAELLLSGVTTVMDMFWFPEETVRAAKALGVRVATGGIFFDPPGMDGHLADRRLSDATAFFDAMEEEPLVFSGCLPHGTYTVSPQHLQNAARLSRSRGGFWCTHAAETAAEQATIIERYGRRVIVHLAELDLLGPDVVLAHCVHLDAAEIGLLARSGTHVVHNPMSNLKLASGFAPVPALMAAGVNVTLGTDGAISGNDLDMWLAIRLAATLHKATTGDATTVTTGEALAMATRNGARALGASDRLGSIEVGKEADLILVDTGRLHAAPLFDPVTHLVYSAGRADVTDVFVGGRRIVEAGRLLTADAGALVAAVAALRPAIAGSVA